MLEIHCNSVINMDYMSISDKMKALIFLVVHLLRYIYLKEYE